MQDWLTVHEGSAPLVIGLPHTGTDIPADIEARLTSPWLARKDADWWIERLYGFAADLDATILRTTISRTVVDVNRDPSGASLYPGQNTTGLVPVTDFDGQPIWTEPPSPEDVADRLARFHAPYHAALRAELERVEAQARAQPPSGLRPRTPSA